MSLENIKPHPKAIHPIKRVGRGPGTGHGKTSGRGHKGQLARGPGARPGFEGGQMPIIRAMPKRGFTFRSKPKFQIINLDVLKDFDASTVVDSALLYDRGIIRSRRVPIKVLGEGELKKPLQLKAHAFSKSALQKIEKAGGKALTVGQKVS